MKETRIAVAGRMTVYPVARLYLCYVRELVACNTLQP